MRRAAGATATSAKAIRLGRTAWHGVALDTTAIAGVPHGEGVPSADIEKSFISRQIEYLLPVWGAVWLRR